MVVVGVVGVAAAVGVFLKVERRWSGDLGLAREAMVDGGCDVSSFALLYISGKS